MNLTLFWAWRLTIMRLVSQPLWLDKNKRGVQALLVVIYYQLAPPIIKGPISSRGGPFLLDLHVLGDSPSSTYHSSSTRCQDKLQMVRGGFLYSLCGKGFGFLTWRWSIADLPLFFCLLSRQVTRGVDMGRRWYWGSLLLYSSWRGSGFSTSTPWAAGGVEVVSSVHRDEGVKFYNFHASSRGGGWVSWPNDSPLSTYPSSFACC